MQVGKQSADSIRNLVRKKKMKNLPKALKRCQP
jgi:hypothetical protein